MSKSVLFFGLVVSGSPSLGVPMQWQTTRLSFNPKTPSDKSDPKLNRSNTISGGGIGKKSNKTKPPLLCFVVCLWAWSQHEKSSASYGDAVRFACARNYAHCCRNVKKKFLIYDTPSNTGGELYEECGRASPPRRAHLPFSSEKQKRFCWNVVCCEQHQMQPVGSGGQK